MGPAGLQLLLLGSKLFCFVKSNVWVCAIFISHCEYCDRWLGSCPRTINEGLCLVYPKIRKNGDSCPRDTLEKAGSGAQAESLAFPGNAEVILQSCRKAAFGGRDARRGWKWQWGEPVEILRCSCLFSQWNKMSGHQLRVRVGKGLSERSLRRDDKVLNSHLGEEKPEFSWWMYILGLPEVEFWLSIHSVWDLGIL